VKIHVYWVVFSVIPNWFSVCKVSSDVGLLYCQTINWCFKECRNSKTSLFTSHVTFQKIWIFISTAMRDENPTCRGLFFYFPWPLQASAGIVPLNDYDWLLSKVLNNDKIRIPLAQVQIFGLALTWDSNFFMVKGQTCYCGLNQSQQVEE